MSENRRLRILCIHGYRQNGQTFREKTGALRKITKKFADLDYITAPHRVPPGNMGSAAWQENPEQDTNGELGWWFSREDEYFKSTDYSDVSVGFEDSVKFVTEVLERGYVEEDAENGETERRAYDGVIGFSQGASLLSILCLMQEQQAKSWFRFAILIAGFKSRSSKHNIYYQGTSPIPSLHVFGETDQIVVPDMSRELLQYFVDPREVMHPGGHFVPSAGPQKQAYIAFLQEMMKL